MMNCINDDGNSTKEEGLIIQSKEYIDKATEEETLPTGYTGSKYSLNRNNAMNKRETSITSSTNTMNGKME